MRLPTGLPIAIVLAIAGCEGGKSPGECYAQSESFVIEGEPDLSMYLRIESCRVDVGACTQLCQTMLERDQLGGVVTACDVEFVGDAVHMSVDYDTCPRTDVPVGAGSASPQPQEKP